MLGGFDVLKDEDDCFAEKVLWWTAIGCNQFPLSLPSFDFWFIVFLYSILPLGVSQQLQITAPGTFTNVQAPHDHSSSLLLPLSLPPFSCGGAGPPHTVHSRSTTLLIREHAGQLHSIDIDMSVLWGIHSCTITVPLGCSVGAAEGVVKYPGGGSGGGSNAGGFNLIGGSGSAIISKKISMIDCCQS